MTFRRVKSRLRTYAAEELKRQRWLLPAAAVLGVVVSVFAILMQSNRAFALGAVLCLFATTYLWGFATRALRTPLWRPTTQFQRREYAAVWDTLAYSPQAASWAAAGSEYEEELRASALPVIRNLKELVGFTAQDDLLEIGCGVGRIGRELAPQCRSWTGSDTSRNMLKYASERVAHLGNVRLKQLEGDGLAGFAANSFDVVYCTNMLAHLDEIDRWRYIQDALRVLRPNGRLFVDTIDIESDQVWASFVQGPTPECEPGNPPYFPRASTGTELINYAKRAGFAKIEVHRRPPLVILTARKA